MSARTRLILMVGMISCFLPFTLLSASAKKPAKASYTGVWGKTIAEQLGWVSSPNNECGGYYLDEPFTYPMNLEKTRENLIEMTGNQGLIAKRATSILEGRVTVTRSGQQVTSNKAYLHRDPNTFKFT